MKSRKKFPVNSVDTPSCNTGRRRFIERMGKVGMGVLVTSSYSVVSLSSFSCSDIVSPDTDFNRAGYGYYIH